MFTVTKLVIVSSLIVLSCSNNEAKQRNSFEAPPGNIDEKLRSGSAAPLGADPTRISPEAAMYDTAKVSEFFTRALLGTMIEIEIAKLAMSNSDDEQVKSYSQMLDQDHGMMQRQLLAIGREEEYAITRNLSAEATRQMDQLRVLKGKAFDSAFLAMTIADHTRDLSEYRIASSTNPNAKLKQYATDAIPLLEKHLAKAQELAQRKENIS